VSRVVGRARWLRYIEAREAGVGITQAAGDYGIDLGAAQSFERGDARSSGHQVWLELCDGKPLWDAAVRAHIKEATGIVRDGSGSAIDREVAEYKQNRDVQRIGAPLSREARRALDDRTGRLFRRRYFGRIIVPWQAIAWEQMRDLADDAKRLNERRYMLLNCPPGVGKTTIGQDWACDRIARDRSTRMGMFSIASSVSEGNVARVKAHLERTKALRATEDERQRGLAVDADACLVADFGAFKPLYRDLWTRQKFNVVQADGEITDDKEPTLAAWGFDQRFIGQRLTDIYADDMVDKSVTRNPMVMANQRETWDREGETRLEPGGLLIMAGQKLSPDDLYAYCERQTIPVFDDDDELVIIDGEAEPRRYFHMKWPAHDESKCTGSHKRKEMRPQPDGCLLDPVRQPWRELAAVQRRDPATYAVVYQQSDSAPGSNLIEEWWIDGGVVDGEIFLGCWDDDRGWWQAPKIDHPWGLGIATVDPSSTKWWAVQAWWYQQPPQPEAQVTYAGRRYLLGYENAKLDAPSLLGMDVDTREFYGVLETMRLNYGKLGLRLNHVIIEANHAQRFLLQLKETHRWSEVYGIHLHAHQTGVDKWDETVGVTVLKDPYRAGRYRLPGKTPADRAHCRDLTSQLYTWGRRTINDQVMANWFLEKKLPSLPVIAPDGGDPVQSRPSWLARRASAGRK